MSTLLESLVSGHDASPERRAALDAVLADGVPGPRTEAWKYTPLRALERRSFGVPPGAAAVDAALLADIPAPRIVFVNGRHAESLSDLSALPDGLTVARHDGSTRPGDGFVEDRPDAVFARLALAAGEGFTIAAADGARIGAPLHLVFIGTPDGDPDLAWHLHQHIELGEGAHLAVIEHHLSDGNHRHLANGLVTLRLAEDAHLHHARIHDGPAGATSFLRTEGRLAASARCERVDVEIGGGLSRHELNMRLEGADARLVANGVLLASGRSHLDTRLGIEHSGRDSSCELLWRGIGSGRGRVVFHGGITIHEGADGTDAQLSNKNLLLSADAEVDTQPVLVIHADEVQAAHGATVGQLDEEALFYLRARGIPAAHARSLLTAAFVQQPLGALDDDLRTPLQARLAQALQALAAA